jgi:hypothetical protein
LAEGAGRRTTWAGASDVLYQSARPRPFRPDHPRLSTEPPSERAGVSDRARRNLGRARTGLEYRRLDDILGDLPTEMENVQRACSVASDAVARRYFPRPATTWWVETVQAEEVP